MRARLTIFVRKVLAWFHSAQRAFVKYDDVWIVLADVDRIECVAECARCQGPATSSRREDCPSDGKTIIIPYCQNCLDSLGRRGAGHLGWVLASVLLGVAGCLFLPLVPWLSKSGAIASAMVVAALPWMFGQLWLLRADHAESSGRRAAYPCPEGLICINGDWAQRLGLGLGAPVQPRRVRVGIGMGWSAAGMIIAATVTPVLHDSFHCETRIVNLSEQDLVVSVDGHQIAVVKATTRENPLAGMRVRIASGSRHIESRRRDGKLAHESFTQLAAGRAYLYAPAHPADVCFWIERTAFGRSRPSQIDREYLPSNTDFWELPISIDSWFAPALGPKSDSFTGGVVTSLRQGDCKT